ncbi:MAG: hypothetical protein IPQ05_05940 [Leptospiraceae bacterium]|nr:hypothetical protein [Leptospiraceae bacterium]
MLKRKILLIMLILSKKKITTGFQDYQDLQDCLVNTKKQNPVNHVNPVKEKDYDRISGLSGFTGLFG